jgi:hypothetical protein
MSERAREGVLDANVVTLFEHIADRSTLPVESLTSRFESSSTATMACPAGQAAFGSG